MSIYLSGDQAGKWMDFATGDGGDLLDLIQYHNGLGLTEAMDWAKKKYGIRDGTPAKKVLADGKKELHQTQATPSSKQ